jgi:hypothetical protein
MSDSEILRKIGEVAEELRKNDKEILAVQKELVDKIDKLEQCTIPEQAQFLRESILNLQSKEGQLRSERAHLQSKEGQLRSHRAHLQAKEARLLSLLDQDLQQHGAAQGPLHKRLKPYNGEAASGFAASKSAIPVNCGFNSTFSTTFNIPLCVRFALSIEPDRDYIEGAKNAIERGRLFTIHPVKVHETGEQQRTVAKTAGSALTEYFSDKMFGLNGTTEILLSNLGAMAGPASGNSHPDVVCVYNPDGMENFKVGLLVTELKDTAYSPVEMQGQAFVSGANLALCQRSLGLASSEVAVPLVLSSGNLLQFAWTTTLEDFFPVLNVTSRVFDVSVPDDLTEAFIALAKAKVFCVKQAGLLKDVVKKDTKIFTSDAAFFGSEHVSL